MRLLSLCLVITYARTHTLMESTRQHKIARLIQKDMSDILLRYARTLSGTLISVSEVRVSPDLAIAHIYLSIFPLRCIGETPTAHHP